MSMGVAEHSPGQAERRPGKEEYPKNNPERVAQETVNRGILSATLSG